MGTNQEIDIRKNRYKNTSSKELKIPLSIANSHDKKKSEHHNTSRHLAGIGLLT